MMGASFKNTKLIGSYLRDAIDLTDANSPEAQLDNAELSTAVTDNAELSTAVTDDADFVGASMTGVKGYTPAVSAAD